MNWSKHGRDGSGRSYHHGNLKEALVEAALALIAQNGPLGFTFAEAARRAGVSPAAPYRHFRDRDDLLADVAARGFERFAADLAAAWNDGLPDPVTALLAVGRAYLDFARGHPGYYAAMFDAGIPADASPALAAAGDHAFAVLRRAADMLALGLPKERRPPALMVALHVWSMAHGVASLFGRPGARPLPMSAAELLEAEALVYLQGLGLTAVVAPPRSGSAPG
jgi:AcrR family transcriptional regulator